MTSRLFKTGLVIVLLTVTTSLLHSEPADLPTKVDSSITASVDKKQQIINIKKLLKEFRKVEYATTCASNAVEAGSDSSVLPSLLFNLAGWEVPYAKDQFNLAMEKYALLLSKCEKDTTGCTDLTDPVIDYSKALQVCRRLLTDHPRQPFIDKVM
jgi:hypothetical protein